MSSLGRFRSAGRRVRAPKGLSESATRSFGASWVNLEGYINWDDDGRNAGGDALNKALAERNFDMVDFERRGFQQDQDIQELNPAALPRPDSGMWGYLYAENLVDALVDLERLPADQEYRRGYLEQEISGVKKKMLVHYPNIDYEAMVKARLAEKEATIDPTRVGMVADAMVENSQKFLDAFNINKYIAKHDDDDEFGYYIPRDLDRKMTNYLQFEYDRVSVSSDKTKYVALLNTLKEAVSAKGAAFGKAAQPFSQTVAAYTEGLLAQNTAESNASLSALLGFVGVSPVVTGRDTLEGGEDASALLQKVAALAGVSGPATEAQAKRLTSLFRGEAATATEAAALKGLDAAGIAGAVTVSEDRVNNLFDALNFLNFVKSSDVAAAFLNGAFHNAPEFFYQFVTDPANLDSFIAENGPVVDEVITNLGAYNKAAGDVEKAFSAYAKGVGAAAVKAGAAKADVDAMDVDAAVNAAADAAGVPAAGADFFLLKRLQAREANGDLFAELTNKLGAYDFLTSGKNQFWFQLLDQAMYPGGATVQRCAAASAEDAAGFVGSLNDAVASSLSLPTTGAAAFKDAVGDTAAKATEALKTSGAAAGAAKAALDESLNKLKFEYDETFSSIKL